MGADDPTWGIAAERWEELRKFRATHPPKHIDRQWSEVGSTSPAAKARRRS